MGTLNTVNNGKGSKARPISNIKKFIDNWGLIFSEKSLAKENKTCDNPRNEDTNSTSATAKRLES
jgi:hypothetical protein